MKNSAKIQKKRDRTSLRLDAELIALIDKALLGRAGIVSRNTWISEAIHEKLGREVGYDTEKSIIPQGRN